MYKLKDLKTVDKNAKFQHKLVVGIEILMAIASIGLMIYHLVTGDPNGRVASTFGAALWFLAPMLLELILKRRVAPCIHIIYTVHIFLAMFLGSGLNLYITVGPYDEIMHFIFGYLVCIYIFYLLISWKDYKRQNPAFVMMMIFLMSLGTACLWEILEFGTDLFFHQHSLGVVPPEVTEQGIALGYKGVRLAVYGLMNGISVWDTITDMCLHLGGTILFSIQYIIHRNIKRPLMLGAIERDFYRNRENFYTFVPSISGDMLPLSDNLNPIEQEITTDENTEK